MRDAQARARQDAARRVRLDVVLVMAASLALFVGYVTAHWAIVPIGGAASWQVATAWTERIEGQPRPQWAALAALVRRLRMSSDS